MFSNFDWFFSDPFFRAPYYYQEPEHSFHLAAHEVENGVEVELEVPRYRTEDIKVTTDVDTGVVTIEGRRAGVRQNVGAHTSTSVPSFKRAFTVAPSQFDLTKLTTKVENGVLTIFVPNKPREAPKRPQAPKATPISIAFPPSADAKAIGAAPSAQGTQGGQVVTGSNQGQVEVQQAGRRGPGQWPPRLAVVQHSAPGVAVTYNVSLPSNVVPENVKLQVLDDGLLRIDVAYSFRKESDHGYEEQSGSCTRFLQLPEGTKPEHVRARVENSQLKVDVQEVAKSA